MDRNTFQILYEDNELIVCVKPAGTATQSRRIGSPDMESILKNHCAKESSNPYLAVIHRLDQPVCGIMVFAKTAFAAKELNRQLQNQGFGKYYRALSASFPKEPEGTLTDYLVKDGRNNISRICTKNTPGAKAARLSYRTVPAKEHFFREEPFEETCCEFDIHLDTGRHHQIRVQLAHMGCPLIGDTKYNTNPDPSQSAPPTPGLRLCSYRLSFRHPKTKKQMTFSLI